MAPAPDASPIAAAKHHLSSAVVASPPPLLLARAPARRLVSRPPQPQCCAWVPGPDAAVGASALLMEEAPCSLWPDDVGVMWAAPPSPQQLASCSAAAHVAGEPRHLGLLEALSSGAGHVQPSSKEEASSCSQDDGDVGEEEDALIDNASALYSCCEVSGGVGHALVSDGRKRGPGTCTQISSLTLPCPCCPPARFRWAARCCCAAPPRPRPPAATPALSSSTAAAAAARTTTMRCCKRRCRAIATLLRTPFRPPPRPRCRSRSWP